MKFEDQMTTIRIRPEGQRCSEGADVRWTDFGGTADQNSRNLRRSARKSAKLEHHRRQQQSSESELVQPVTTTFQSCCSRVPAISAVVAGSSDGCDDAVGSYSVSDASAATSWTNGFRWHRHLHQYQWVAVLYIVAVVLVGAISEVHCDAASSRSSTDDGGSSSGTEKALDGGHFLEDHYEGGGHYTHHWAVHIPEGGLERVDQVAQEHGFINHGKILDGYYHFEHRHVQRRSVNPAAPHQRRLDEDDRIHWSQQQRAKRRTKRDFRPLKSPYLIQLNDPKWPEMWYLNRGNGLDMNVIPAWKEGVTGKGVVVTILDDGLESDHPDLEHNYDPGASYDVNGNDGDPMPHYDLTDSNRHGTRCAGEVAATANNSKCAVGIAYGARVGGVRMLDGDVTDVVEAKSLGLHSQHIDIYSASWGPDDDGKTVDGPGDMATRAFIEGVRKGRGGKGSIFIWASGNGGREHDNCNCDGYTNSIWTLSISSASQEGLVPWFSEMCSSTLATTYSSGNTNEKQVITTDLHHSCTSSHTGTSASAPLAAGIAALVLEANRNLTWRDLQHIVVRTAKPGNLKDPSWAKNGVGRRVSHSFGYGLMDAAAMVRLARTWKTVPDQQICEINAPHLDKQIPPRTKVTLQLLVEHCMGVNYLEHVQAKITLTSQRRGDIQIFLTSPSGTRVTLLTPRSHDLSRSGFNQWPFMSVHTWGEAPHGVWLLEIHNEGRLLGYSSIRGWSLILYGTSIPPDPNDPPNTPRVYSTPALPPAALPPIIPASGSFGSSKNFYSSTALGKPNRKQQQQYGGATYTPTFGMTPAYQSPQPVTPPRKNNKGKNKPNKNQSSKTTTARPVSQTTLNVFLNSYGTGKKYEYNTGPRKNQTPKPRPMQTINYGRSDKYHAATSNIPEKQPIAIKAPKQVKQDNAPNSRKLPTTVGTSSSTTHSVPSNAATTGTTSGGTTSLTTQPPIFNERFSTTNARIPNRFQQYEKIQQFYPELKPYSSIRDDLDHRQTSQTNKPPAAAVPPPPPPKNTPTIVNSGTNGKPSRANPKIFFPDTDIIDAIAPRKISSSLQQQQPVQPAFYGRTQNSQFVSSSGGKNGKAQITQWNLIFYGTETPAQPDDPTRVGKPGFSDSNFGGEIEHNSLEFESGVSSDQWRNMQQIGESHVDVQRTASSDVTSLACLRYDRARCLECGSASFFNNGHCYSSCPASTFPDTSTMEEEQLNQRPQQQQQRPLPPGSLRRHSSSSSSRNNNLDNEPQERDTQPQPGQQHQHFCIPCHATCLECSGPAANQCTECQPEFAFDGLRLCVTINGKQRPASSGSNKSSIQVQEGDDKRWLPADYLIMIAVVGVTLVVAFAGIYLLWRRCFRGVLLATDHHQYDRVETSDPAASGSRGVPSYAELVRDEIDDILAESSTEDEEHGEQDGRESRTFMSGRIIAPVER